MYKDYNIFNVLSKSIEDFDNNKVQVIAGDKNDSERRYLGNGNMGYEFSQKELLSDIDMAYNSVYKNGKYDKEGQRKSYLNVVRFYVYVAVKNTNPNIADYVFTPTDYSKENIWGVWFTKRQFAMFVRDEGYGATEDALHFDFCKYGTAVAKRVKDDLLKVPLRALRCNQNAECLLDGVKAGTPMTIEHQMSYVNYQDYKEQWAEIDLYDGLRCVYEMYSYMTRGDLMKLKGEDPTEADFKEMVLTMSIIMPAKTDDGNEKQSSKLLFIEELDEEDWPFEEVHSEKQDNRWLGIGNVEKQLENQIARNTTVNLRRRSELWASKHIFYTMGDAIGKNLVKNVQDGEILQVGLNGQIARIDTGTRGLSDFSADEQVWEDNGQKQSFSFEAATGESMQSGTPFRLGAMLSNSVMGYFTGQKEIFGRFRENLYYNQLIPIFKKRAKDDMAVISETEEGFNKIKQLYIDYHVNDYFTKLALSEDYFKANILSREEVEQMFTNEISKMSALAINVPKEIYKNAKYTIRLDLSNSTPVGDAETLTTVYTELSRKGDPMADKVLEVILASKGQIMANIAGSVQPTSPMSQNTQATAQNPNLQGLTPQA